MSSRRTIPTMDRGYAAIYFDDVAGRAQPKQVFHARGSSFEIVSLWNALSKRTEQVVAFKTTEQHVDVMDEWKRY
jgi:hypothetical protein